MIKEIHFENWKSFGHAVLPIDPLTVLIGANASGKSNAVEGLRFLYYLSRGEPLDPFPGDSGFLVGVRGGAEWTARKPESRFTLKALIQGEDEKTDYLYSVTIDTASRAQLFSEELRRIVSKEAPRRTMLYSTEAPDDGSQGIIVALHESRQPSKRGYVRNWSILSQIQRAALTQEVHVGVDIVSQALQGIFVLNPEPAGMRDYSPLSLSLASNASNIAGVLAGLPELQKKKVEQALLRYLTQLPEGEIRHVWAETIGRYHSDAMLYCIEEWIPGQLTDIDARGMSDGTLRLIAILTTLLTRPEGSQVVIEEVDSGLHPSRARLLLSMLQEIGAQRNIDVLVTTHNPALLDELVPDFIPFVAVTHRDRNTGESRITLLEDIDYLPKLIASGPLGKIVAQGAIEESLSEESDTQP